MSGFKFERSFVLYNYITALLLLFIIATYNIGFWPFTEDILSKSYLPENMIFKVLMLSGVFLGQLLLLLLVLFVLTTQHKSAEILFTEV